MVDREIIKAVAYDLLGSCDDINHVLEGYSLGFDDLTIEDLRTVDDITICCDCCGWWVDPNELNDENFCNECVQE